MSVAARALHGVNVCIIPTPDNDDRPLLLRAGSLKLIATLLIMAKIAAAALIALTPTYAELSTITTDRIVQLTNAERVKAGLKPLAVNSQLAAAARDKAEHMLAEDYFAHISPSGVTPWFWMSRHGYEYQVAGENLAIDFVEAENVVAAWIASPSHKENLLHDRYTETGVAVATGEFQGASSTMVVHMFGLPPEGAVAADTSEPTPTIEPTPVPATPVPTPVSTPVPTAAPERPQPRTPRIALAEPGAVVRSEAEVVVEGQTGTEVALAINDIPVTTLSITNEGQTSARIDVSQFSDGQLVLTAVTRVAGEQSAASRLVVTKDATGPTVGGEQLAFLVGPLFDRKQAYLRLPTDTGAASWSVNGTLIENGGAVVGVDEALRVAAVDDVGNETTLDDVQLRPQFEVNPESSPTTVPTRLAQYSTRFISTTLMVITGLLILTVVVRMQIQRPQLLGQTMVVILLAGTLLWL